MTKAPSRYLEGVYTDTFINTKWIPPPLGSHVEATQMRNPFGVNKCIRVDSFKVP
jgi:hypothetical protein